MSYRVEKRATVVLLLKSRRIDRLMGIFRAKLLAVAEELGHEIRIFTNSANSAASKEISASSSEEPDHFYDLTPEDYYRIMSDRIRGNVDTERLLWL
ncbi:plant UBX domain-containing protein 1-like [Phoenix dactylifera]|uniref:Plant UBX domain-containing protein 1-like n=1 Tax=Phoenix dactylifera TaxID=42345 RepID=A0A8B8ZV08_PHODC|nr:plant UBX domain-containing protein 1-like [Phoenix dactylifera]